MFARAESCALAMLVARRIRPFLLRTPAQTVAALLSMAAMVALATLFAWQLRSQ